MSSHFEINVAEFVLENTVSAYHLVCFDNKALDVYLMVECFGCEISSIYQFSDGLEAMQKFQQRSDHFERSGWKDVTFINDCTIDCDGSEQANFEIAEVIRCAIPSNKSIQAVIHTLNGEVILAKRALGAKQEKHYTNFGAWA